MVKTSFSNFFLPKPGEETELRLGELFTIGVFKQLDAGVFELLGTGVLELSGVPGIPEVLEPR